VAVHPLPLSLNNASSHSLRKSKSHGVLGTNSGAPPVPDITVDGQKRAGAGDSESTATAVSVDEQDVEQFDFEQKLREIVNQCVPASLLSVH
jgi:hypothetical protein